MHSAQRKPSGQSQRSSLRSTRSATATQASMRHPELSSEQQGAAQPHDDSSHLHDTPVATSAPSTSKWWHVHLFRGMVNDVKRRAPYYWSDWTDAWDYRVVPATIYMYFAKYVGPALISIYNLFDKISQ